MKTNFAKKLILVLAFTFALVLCCGLFACGNDSEQQSNSESASSSQNSEMNNNSSGETVITGELSFKTLEVSGNSAYGKVSNATSKFAFADEIEASDDYDYVVALDEFGIQTSLTKEVPLSVGDNLFYIFENKNGSIVNTYVVTIRRRPIHTVQFNTNGGISISSQNVEEDGFANEPTSDPKKTGYTFDGWDYDFNQAITSNKTVNANWQAITYSLSYDLNGGTLENANPTEYTIESEFYLNAPTKNSINQSYQMDYEFLGWYDGDVKVTTLKGCTGNKTLTARWGGEYLFFGEYPQTIKADGVSITSTTNEKGYFLGSDGAWYAGVTATPYDSSYTFSNNASITSGTTYYFKVEPIKWQVLSTDGVTAKVVCASIIANRRFDDSSNNYEQSEIRAWLNNEFYNQAFSDLQKELIVTTLVDNSAASTGNSSTPYGCKDTNDKIYLLSYAEAVAMGSNKARERLTSDYTRATGAYMYTSTSYNGNGYWVLRSSFNRSSSVASFVIIVGFLYIDFNVSGTYFGVVPALQIRL